MSSPTRCLISAHEVFAVRRALEMSVDHGIARPESSMIGRRRRAADSCRLPTMSRTDVMASSVAAVPLRAPPRPRVGGPGWWAAASGLARHSEDSSKKICPIFYTDK